MFLIANITKWGSYTEHYYLNLYVFYTYKLDKKIVDEIDIDELKERGCVNRLYNYFDNFKTSSEKQMLVEIKKIIEKKDYLLQIRRKGKLSKSLTDEYFKLSST